MDRHINFIENEYNTIRNPLNYICETVSTYKKNILSLSNFGYLKN